LLPSGVNTNTGIKYEETKMARRKRVIIFAAVGSTLVLLSSVTVHERSKTCKKRGEALQMRFEKLKRDAHTKLTTGTKKEELVKFFADNGFPITFSDGNAGGAIYTTGCAPFGCGDSARLGISVPVDAAGTVIAETDVTWMDTDCL
jgi:hypothetical protein